jgi:hypothetical protein
VVEYLPGTLEGLGSIGTSERERQKKRVGGRRERKKRIWYGQKCGILGLRKPGAMINSLSMNLGKSQKEHAI